MVTGGEQVVAVHKPQTLLQNRTADKAYCWGQGFGLPFCVNATAGFCLRSPLSTVHAACRISLLLLIGE